jgi:hypothetical protein
MTTLTLAGAAPALPAFRFDTTLPWQQYQEDAVVLVFVMAFGILALVGLVWATLAVVETIGQALAHRRLRRALLKRRLQEPWARGQGAAEWNAQVRANNARLQAQREVRMLQEIPDLTRPGEAQREEQAAWAPKPPPGVREYTAGHWLEEEDRLPLGGLTESQWSRAPGSDADPTSPCDSRDK